MPYPMSDNDYQLYSELVCVPYDNAQAVKLSTGEFYALRVHPPHLDEYMVLLEALADAAIVIANGETTEIRSPHFNAFVIAHNNCFYGRLFYSFWNDGMGYVSLGNRGDIRRILEALDAFL